MKDWIWSTASPSSGIKNEAVLFRNYDIDSSIELLETFLSFNFPAKFDLNNGDTDYSKFSILKRAAELVELTKPIPITKPGSFCSDLECLFNTDAREGTHKVSESIAIFLSDNPTKRIDISKKIRITYSHKSSPLAQA